MKENFDVSCIVIAGGKGERLGGHKAQEVVGNKSLLEWSIFHLSFISSDIIIVIAEGQSPPPFSEQGDLRTVTDIYPKKGPLGGVYTGLTVSNSYYNVVVACDMPFLNQSLLRYMIKLSPGYDMVVPRLGSLVEPLHAIYSKKCLPIIEQLLKQGKLNLSYLLTSVKVRYMEGEEIEQFDPDHLSFFNVNSAADLKRARELNSEHEYDKC